jgi:hypothetical protein
MMDNVRKHNIYVELKCWLNMWKRVKYIVYCGSKRIL